MAHGKLQGREIETVKTLSLQGETPGYIKDYLKTTYGVNIGLSTIHNYKEKISESEGIEFPVVRGKRPNKVEATAAGSHSGSGSYNPPRTAHIAEPVKPRTSVSKDSNVLGVIKTEDTEQKVSRFIINGVSVEVRGAKKVIIGEDSMEIIY